jgi:hypothetical protein
MLLYGWQVFIRGRIDILLHDSACIIISYSILLHAHVEAHSSPFRHIYYGLRLFGTSEYAKIYFMELVHF